TGGTSLTNVLSNDTLNGSAVVPSDVNTTFVSATNAGITLSGTDVLVAPGTPAGNYTLTYRICEKLNPTNCDDAVVTVTVTAGAIVATDDTGSPVNSSTGGTSLTNVLTNDILNGSAVVPSDVNTTFVSATNPGITLSGTDVLVAPNTPAGTYTLTYRICEKLNPTNCDQATVSVTVVAGVIVATDDAGISVNGSEGGTSLTNVLTNDTLNGSAVVPSEVNTTFVSATNPGITLSGTNVLVAPGTPAGSYALTYRICEKLNSSNCDDAVVTVQVFSNPSIALVKTAVFKDENGDGHAQAGESVIYSFEVTNTGDVALTNVSLTDPLPGIVLTGSPISLAVGESDRTTFVGVYTLKQSDINLGSVSNQATVSGTSYDGIIVKDNSDDMSTVGDNPTVLKIEGCSIEVFNAVSPNADGSNDLFYVRGLECYPENSVEIYNRWGVLVFERDNYNNSDRAFKGISEGRVTINASAELPVGTYYYILKYKDYNSTGHQKAGYLYINRK
ncbi:gliding motility-associated C-terminal domain-containing protein, partial [Flavobacterium sp. T12S277]|uniref:gliding motility-associated C-terminal domain-containing protein n=1 Tax=Flavobacterium sp. T12S277 TaxID=3402752 RepID=UPI003AEA4410